MKKILFKQVNQILGFAVIILVSLIAGGILLNQAMAQPAEGYILNRIGTNADSASMSSTLFAGQQKIYDNLGSPDYYITTTRSLYGERFCGSDEYPVAYCPGSWTVVSSWTYKTVAFEYTPGPLTYNCWRQTLCRK